MTDAHAAVAFSFSITHDGFSVNYDREVAKLIWFSGIKSWQKRCSRFLNNVKCGVYPASLSSLYIIIATLMAIYIYGIDVSSYSLLYLTTWIPGGLIIQCIVGGAFLWMLMILILRYTLKMLFLYKGWLYENISRKISLKTKIWGSAVKILTSFRTPMLYSFQSSLPRLPLPSVEETMTRYLKSVEPLLSKEEFSRVKILTEDFKNGVGKKLQRYLLLKSWLVSNYVTDWWEEYAYLRGRSPLLMNTNCYGLAFLYHPTKIQSARGAVITYAFLSFRKGIYKQDLKPIMIRNFVPLCCRQYERMFNTTRIPGIEGDQLVHFDHGNYIIVYNRGRFFKMPFYCNGRLLNPSEIQMQLEEILSDNSLPDPGEEHLAALTTLDRDTWAKARQKYFSSGINQLSLKTIEGAAFVLNLSEEEHHIDLADGHSLEKLSNAIFHGSGYDIWCDKTMTIIVTKNGRIGCNAEHSWCDASTCAHTWEYWISMELFDNVYTEDGNINGQAELIPPTPIRLKWDLDHQCLDTIKNAVVTVERLISDVDLKIYVHFDYGKEFIKTCKLSPDAYLQMAMQLAYFRDQKKFCLTYESTSTRLFREGRTETIRSATMESCTFVRGMENPDFSPEKKKQLLRQACQAHQHNYLNAMTGKGIDRHLFCLYIVCKYLELDSPFLKEVLSEPWRLSTSQCPHNVLGVVNPESNPDLIFFGGGFGPVAHDGYGVCYVITGDSTLIFHISSKRSSKETDTGRYIEHLKSSLRDLRLLAAEPVRNGFKQTS